MGSATCPDYLPTKADAYVGAFRGGSVDSRLDLVRVYGRAAGAQEVSLLAKEGQPR